MNDLEKKSILLLGLGRSNKAVFDFFKIKGLTKSVKIKENVRGQIKTSEDFVFRSPSIKPSQILASGRVFTEIGFSLESSSCTKIAVTGSDGKTTTSTLISKILEGSGKKTYLVGNIGCPLIAYLEEIKPSDVVVCELSSFQLMDMYPSLDVSVITNVTENHLDWHKDMSEYVDSKLHILKNARNVVLNYDCEYTKNIDRENITLVSLSDLSYLVGNGKSYAYLKDDVLYLDSEPIINISEIKLKGKFNLYNILFAISATKGYATKDAQIKVLRTFSGVEGRMEIVDTISGVTFINSSIDSTPARTCATLSAFEKEKTIVILGGYDKNLSYEPLKEATDGLKLAIILGENKQKIIKNQRARRSLIVNTLEEATKLAYKNAENGDIVVLSPASASFDMFESYKQRAECFKDIIGGLKNGRYKENT